jgi:hypothetical protein
VRRSHHARCVARRARAIPDDPDDSGATCQKPVSAGGRGVVRAARDAYGVALVFRFYDQQRIQVGTCQSYPATVETELDQRITCSTPLIIDMGSPQPVNARADPLPIWE